VDDFILLHPSSKWLGQALDSINTYLPKLGLSLNPRKTIIQPVDRGVDFAGHVIKPWRREIRRRSVRSALQRIEDLPQEKVFETGNSYLGLLRHADGHRDRALIANALRKRGHSVSADLTKAYR
ncbi:reverse transcriptase, partial [Achromobacter xylosoxidans]